MYLKYKDPIEMYMHNTKTCKMYKVIYEVYFKWTNLYLEMTYYVLKYLDMCICNN